MEGVFAMRVMATSDIHGSEDIYDKLRDLTKEDCDVLVLNGDLYGKDYNFKTSAELANYQENDYNLMIEVLDSLKDKGIAGIYINGNDDYFENEDDEYHLIDSRIINGFKFVPFPFIGITPWHTRNELDEYDLKMELERLDVDEDTIIVGHMPPYGIGDTVGYKSIGSTSYREYIANNDFINVVLCGHIHECGLEAGEIGRTIVLNCASEYQSGILWIWILWILKI